MLNYKNSFFQTIRQKLFLLQEHCKRNLLQFIPCLAFHSNKQSWMRPGKKQASSCTGPAKVGSQPAVAITISRTPDSRSKSRSLQLLKLKLTLLVHGMGVPCLLSSFLPLPSFLPFFSCFWSAFISALSNLQIQVLWWIRSSLYVPSL